LTTEFKVKRGYVYLVNLNPVKGAETGNVTKVYPFEVFIPKGTANLTKDSKAKANQIRTIDKSRIIREIGKLLDSLLKELEKAIKIHIDLWTSEDIR
jgi:mRNA interferase MazF